MKKRQLCNVALAWCSSCLLFASFAFSSDGIAVTGHWSGSSYAETSYSISRFDIAGDYVTKITALYTATADKGGCKPAINPSGTHVAFNRIDKKTNTWYLSVMDIEKGEAGTVYDLTEIPARTDLEWLSDQWIYYTKGSGLWKINPADKSQNSKIWDFPGSRVLSLRISSNGARMHSFYMSADEDVRSRFVRKTDGTYDMVGGGGGCSPAISPSGNLITFHVGAGHVEHMINQFDGTEESLFYVLDDSLNVWGMKNWPSGTQVMMCSYSTSVPKVERPIGMGSSTTGHAWSCNSDKWILGQTGTDTRYLDCGSNMITFNYIDKKAINITKGFRSCKEDKERVLCDIRDADIAGGTIDKHAETGDFWLSSLNDVNADLRCYVNTRAEWKTYWTTVLAGGNTTKPSCETSAVLKSTLKKSIFLSSSPQLLTFAGVARLQKAISGVPVKLYTLQGSRIARDIVPGKKNLLSPVLCKIGN